MILHIDESWILEVAERAGHHGPGADDYGVPIAAVARHRGELLESPVYDGLYARAAAPVHTWGRCRWLERSPGCSPDMWAAPARSGVPAGDPEHRCAS